MRAWLVVMVLVAACGDNALYHADAQADAPLGVKDVRVPIPVPDPSYVDLITPEAIIEPGQEIMTCVHYDLPASIAADSFLGMQGAFGHHLALFTTTDPKPDGTVEDCTSAAANAKLTWFLFNVNFPGGFAVNIPDKFHVVLQYHYINSSDTPLLVRDIGRIHHVDASSISTWVVTMMETNLSFSVPEGASSTTFDCTVPTDRDLLEIFGHLHEMGSSYEIQIGATPDTLKTVYTIDPWKASFRDGPPATLMFDHPLHIPAGSTVRSTCSWINTTDQPIGYPQEMCTSFGYVAAPAAFQCQK